MLPGQTKICNPRGLRQDGHDGNTSTERRPKGHLIKRPNHLKLALFDAKELPPQWIATLLPPSWELCCQWSQRRGETKSRSEDSNGQVIKVLEYLTLNGQDTILEPGPGEQLVRSWSMEPGLAKPEDTTWSHLTGGPPPAGRATGLGTL